jgi:hypothetical protein
MEDAMRYMLLLYDTPGPGPAHGTRAWDASLDAYDRFAVEATRRGALRSGEALQPIETATTVRVRDGDVLTADGPFAPTDEVLGGMYIVECADLDEALDLAARVPDAATGSVEVRPIVEVP